MTNKLKVIFFGTSQFAATILESLVKTADFNIAAVITETGKPAGRKLKIVEPPVKIAAQKLNLPIIQPVNLLNDDFIKTLKNLKPELAVLAAYNKKIPKEILTIPKNGFLNVHPSLLPKYRGASPIQTVILNGEKKTGVSIILMDEKIDRGPVLSQKKISLAGAETAQELGDLLARTGAEILIESVKDYLGGKIKPKKQDNSQATFTKKFSREDGKIDWKKPAEEIERMVRALYPWPGAWTEIKDMGRIKITNASVLKDSPPKIKPGKFFEINKKPAVACGKNALVIEKLVPEGKKEMSGEEFLRGRRGVANE